MGEMTQVEMKPAWWRYAVQALGIGRREVKAMHPREREVHDTDVENYDEAIRRINTSGVQESDAKWESLELTQTDLKCIYEGLVDLHFRAREKAGGDWSNVDHPSEYQCTEYTIRQNYDPDATPA